VVVVVVVTVKLYVAVLVMLPPVPETVMLYVPAGVDEEVEIVNVEEQVGLQLVGLNEHEAPAGRPAEHVKLTDWVVPAVNVAVTAVCLLCP
jgi:hypothetical protein